MKKKFKISYNAPVILSFLLVGILFIGKEIYSVFAVRDNVSNLTHIVGGAVGGAMGYFLNKKR